jgi:DNA polymerase III alpha subunit (gram-positive type)
MKLFLYDLETSGLSPVTNDILEIGYIVKYTEYKKPIEMGSILVEDAAYLPNEVAHINHITSEHLRLAAHPVAEVLEKLERVFVKHEFDYMVAHNGTNFDLPFLIAKLDKYEIAAPTIRKTPLIDTRTDIPYEPTPKSRHLGHLGYDHGVINLFPHAALTDCLVMDALIDHYGIDKIVSHMKQPVITLKAKVDRETKDRAKYSGYKYNPADYSWTKEIKEGELEKEIKTAREKQFEVEVIYAI